MTSPNEHIWRERGLNPSAHDHADASMHYMLLAIEYAAAPGFARAVFEEALFQFHELPKRTPAFQKAHRWRKP